MTYGTNMGPDHSSPARGGAACDDVIERLTAKSRRFQYIAAIICGIANASDAVEVLCLSFVLDQVEGMTDTNRGERRGCCRCRRLWARGEACCVGSCALHAPMPPHLLSPHRLPAASPSFLPPLLRACAGILSSTVYLGMLVGGLAAGVLGDRLGRKPLLLLSLTTNAIFGALSGALPYWQWLAVCRVLAGVGVGGSIPTLFTLFAEYLPRHNRGSFISLVAWWWMWGSVTVAGTGWVMIGVLHWSWRVFVLATAIPATIAAILVATVLPESPRYLYSRGRQVRCVASLETMAAWNRVPSSEVDVSGAILKEQRGAADGGLLQPGAAAGSSASSDAALTRNPFVALSRAVVAFCDPRTTRRPALLLSAVWFTLSFGYYGVNSYLPTLFAATGLHLDVFQDTFLAAAATLPGNIVATLLMDRVNRRTLLAGSLVATCLCAALFAGTTSSEAAVVTAACLLNAVSVGTWNTLDALSVEHFPTHLRTSAMGILAASGRLGSIVGQLVFSALVHVSVPGLLSLAAGLLLIGAVCALALPARTAMDEEQAETGAALSETGAGKGMDEDERGGLLSAGPGAVALAPVKIPRLGSVGADGASDEDGDDDVESTSVEDGNGSGGSSKR
jgi:MFS transporter, VNT family, synaptic vesicle glycoprotein 2